MESESGFAERIALLMESIGFESSSFERLLEWVLDEELVAVMAADPLVAEAGFFSAKDSLRRFRDRLADRTRRTWAHSDVDALFRRVKAVMTKHDRRPISAEEYLKLLWQVPLECVYCRRRPPEVTLQVDHVFPSSKGGASKRPNLQFLCAEDNLRKSDNLEVAEPWLSLL
jgi:5-methylcytosine-specific restriction endonuclease McrA